MDLLSGLIPWTEESTVSTLSAQHLQRLFLFSVMWSVGALLELEDRSKMEQFIMNNVSATQTTIPCAVWACATQTTIPCAVWA